MTVIESMHSWYYEKKDLKRTPSVLGGLNIERESRYRSEGARFIINVGTKMGLHYDTIATGVVYFHRFYMFHSFITFPRYVTACCCLFLAGKVEETPKRCKDIIRTAKSFLAESQFAQFGDDPKEGVMTLEKILLQTIKFDLQVDHPYGHLLRYAKALKGDRDKLNNMVQRAWIFINDSLCTTLCLQWEPEVIAVALMYLAGKYMKKLSNFEIVDWNGRKARQRHWWDMFIEGLTIELLEDICHQVLDFYSMPIPQTLQDSPPATPPIQSTETEAKEIPTISSHSPKAAPSSLESDTQLSSPSSPLHDSIKIAKDNAHITSAPVYKSGWTPNSSKYVQNPSFTHTESPATKLNHSIPTVTYSVTTPPPTVSYAHSAPSLFSDNQPFPNVQQPPPQLFSPRPPVQFQHPPPASPSGPLPSELLPMPPPHQYPPGVPPFNSQVPPPRHQPPPGLVPNPPPRHQPPPGLVPNPPPTSLSSLTQHPPPSSLQGMPPVPSMIHSVPPPPGVPPVHHMVPDNMYRPGSDLYSPDQRNQPLKVRMTQDFGPRPRFERNFRRRRSDFNRPFARNASYRRHLPQNEFNQRFENRQFPLKQQHEPHPSTANTSLQQQGAPTGILPVRITGSE